ncbi:hypothetical protein MXB_1493 [Myxobolus squamalis]|nr:hypothetical protein MXB_1493 [Myxobolus squamalis]
MLYEQGSSVGELIKMIGRTKALVKIQPDGKYLVDVDKRLDINTLKPGVRVALKSDSYILHKVLPTKVDPLINLMMVEKVPDSTYENVGGLQKQIQEIKEVIELPIKHPQLFERLGISQPKGVLLYGPPGTGKTLLARAVAHHTDCHFIRVSGSELVQKFIGEGSRLVSEALHGATGAEIKGVCTEAGMYALRERRFHVTQEDFEMAVAKVLQKDSEKDMSLRKLWK